MQRSKGKWTELDIFPDSSGRLIDCSTPEKRLLAAILLRALADYLNNQFLITGGRLSALNLDYNCAWKRTAMQRVERGREKLESFLFKNTKEYTSLYHAAHILARHPEGFINKIRDFLRKEKEKQAALTGGSIKYTFGVNKYHIFKKYIIED